jgi:hypothetical protein
MAFMASPIHLRGFSDVLELWRSGMQAILLGICPDVTGTGRFREGKPPCHHIPLNERNDTIQSLQQWSTPEELEDAGSEWLTDTIRSWSSSEP